MEEVLVMKRINVIDLASGLYMGVRVGEPLFKAAKGEWTLNQVSQELAYRFGGIGSDGKPAPMGAIVTYAPPLVMQIMKKVLHKAGFRMSLGPFSL